MEDSNSIQECNSEEFFFFDAVDKSLLPNSNSSSIMANGDSEGEFGELPNLYRLQFVEDGGNEVVLIKVKQSSELTLLNGFKSRAARPFRSNYRGVSNDYSKDCNSLVISDITQISDGATFTRREKRSNFYSKLNDQEEKVSQRSCNSPLVQLVSDCESETEQDQEKSSFSYGTRDLPLRNTSYEDPLSSFLVFLAGLVFKAMGFQFSLFVNFFTFPIWFMYCSMIFITDPFRVFKWVARRTTQRLFSIGGGVVPVVLERVTGERSIGKLLIRLGWGVFWSIYVCSVLFGILVSGFIIGGVVMRYVVEEPIQTTEPLNFDYTKSSPVALVPLMACPSESCGMNCAEKFELGKLVGSRVIPPNHKLKLTVSLTMPESEYNRKLGVFQVRVDFLSANGKVTTSSSYPCMLRFKSQLIRSLETLIKSVPLLTGYSSESQILDVKMKGFSEENEPTSCLKVSLEQRAQYNPGAGIPEIYAASMVLESELPLHKRVIWYWRKTIFVWTSIMSFLMELLLILVCCRPIILPRVRTKGGSAIKKIASDNTIPLIKGR